MSQLQYPIYDKLIDSYLYDDRFVINFVQMLKTPEVYDQSNELLKHFVAHEIDPLLMFEWLNTINSTAQEQVLATGTFCPQFVGFTAENTSKITFGPGIKIPTTKNKIQEFLAAGKALAFVRQCCCVFFCTMQTLNEEVPAFREDVNNLSPWGLLTIGSSITGHCPVLITGIRRNNNGIEFYTITQRMLREGMYNYPFSQFYHIENPPEMERIILQIKSLMKKSNLSLEQCVTNFATTIRGMHACGYNA